MNKLQIVYVPIGVPTFHLESAQAQMDHSVELLRSLAGEADLRVPEEMLLGMDVLEAFLDSTCPDLVILQNLTFANAAYAGEVVRRFSCPLVLWALREPVIDGGRLRLNSLTGAFSAANTVKQFRREPLEFVFGAPEEESVAAQLRAVIAAASLKKSMQGMRLAAVGHTPQGFGFGRSSDAELLHTFGVRLESIEARELIDLAKSYSDEEILSYLQDADRRTVGLSETPDRNRKDFARLSRAYQEYVEKNHIQALASRCWPDFFTAFGTPVCMVLGILNDLGIAASCECDVLGALSMYAGMQLTGSPAFFGDPVSLDEKAGTVTFWHCGTAACSLAREDTGAKVDVHCNRKIGPTLDFGCRPSAEGTIFRIGRDPEGKIRFLIASGEILDAPRQFHGTSLVFRTKCDARAMVEDAVKNGWEPHYAVLYGDVAEALKAFGHMLNLEVVCY